MDPSTFGTGKFNMKCAEIWMRDREDGERMMCIREFRYVNTKIYFKENGAVDESKDMSFFDEEKHNEVLEKVFTRVSLGLARLVVVIARADSGRGRLGI